MEANKRHKVIIIIVAIILGFGVGLSTIENFAPVLFARFTNTIEEGDLSGREVLFDEAWQIITKHPILGGDPILLFPNSDYVSGYHNGYLTVGVAMGIWGLVLYVGLVCSLVFSCWKNRKYLRYSIDYFVVGFLGYYIMRSMSGASIITTAKTLIALGLACYFIASKNYLSLRNDEYENL